VSSTYRTAREWPRSARERYHRVKSPSLSGNTSERCLTIVI